jgi:hypothetical protein
VISNSWSSKVTPMRAGVMVSFLAFAFFSIAVNAQSRGWDSWYLLASHGREARATVTRTQPESHQTCYFFFSVDAKRYEGADQGCSAEVGQSLTIRYLPTDPSFATSSSPIGQLAFLVFGPLVLSVLGGVLAAWRVVQSSRCPSSG